MGFFKLFIGKSFETLEKKADAFLANGAYGSAKIEYERALGKLEKTTDGDQQGKSRLEKKRQQSMEGLAIEHKQNGERLLEAACYPDAIELLHLAQELTRDPNLSAEIEKRLAEIRNYPITSVLEDPPMEYHQEDGAIETAGQELYAFTDEENFTAVCNALPEEERKAYHSYGHTFKRGYIALNQGDFELALIYLSQAMDEEPRGSYIPLELATAHLNLGDHESARQLLVDFLKFHPDSLKTYYLISEIFWEKREFNAALELLESCPPEISTAFPIRMLKGETLFRSENFQEAADHFLHMMEIDGYDQIVAQSLAKTYEALGLPKQARDLYAEIFNSCQGCGSTIDLFVKQRYAETSFETGDLSPRILELYFSLTQEDPDNRAHYFQRIGRIYQLQGNDREARRYFSLAGKR